MKSWVIPAIFILGTIVSGAAALAGLGEGVEVLQSDESGITLKVEIDSFTVEPVLQGARTFHSVEVRGFAATEEEGLPQLPFTTAMVAIPFGTAAKLTVVLDETAARPGVVPMPTPRAFIAAGEFPTPALEFAIDESFYAGDRVFPSELARLSAPSTLRHQKVVSVSLFPFRYNPASRELIYSKKLVVRLDFTKIREPERINLEAAPSFELNAEGLYQGLLINYKDAKGWRMKPLSPLSQSREIVLPVAQAQNEYKIAIDSTGLYKVFFSNVPGLTVAYPVEQVRLFEKFYQEGDPSPFKQADVPIHLVDQNSNGYFDGSDYFVFYGLSLRDRRANEPIELRYSYDNVYWLTVGGADGLSMNLRGSWRSAPSPQQPQSFLQVDRYEQDRIYMNVPPREAMDYYFWISGEPYDTRLPFSIFAPDTTRAWRFRARYQGYLQVTHNVTDILENSRGRVATLIDTFFITYSPNFKAEAMLDTDFTIPDSLLASGTNTIRYIGQRQLPGDTVHFPGSGAYLDWFEISYFKKYVAGAGKLAFSSGAFSGEIEVGIDGFPSGDMFLYDVTDSLNPVRLSIETWQVTFQSGAYRLEFRDSVGVLRRYVAATPAAVRPVPNVSLDVPSSLSSSGASKDYFVIAYDQFAPLLAPLVSHRESQGHRVELAKISDVFDEFNGGVSSPRAIRRYMKYAYNTWGTPLFLLLFGDASEDYKGMTARSNPDFVPGYLMLSPIIGPSGKELVANEQWFVTALDGVEDNYPDMYVGRLTVGSNEEASAMVQKILAYETFSPGQDFRGRGLFVADDAYSSTDMVDDRLRLSERIFESISNEAKWVVNQSPAAPGFAANTFYLSTYLDSVPSYPKPTSVPLAEIVDYVRANVKPKFFSALSEGGLFVNYQGHGNPFQLAHEQLFYSSSVYDDVPSVLNYYKPWLFSAFSCHIGDFDSATEKDNGECVGEKFLLSPNLGAIAIFSSDAFENLPISSRADMNVPLFDAFFGSPPTADLRGKRGARWILGEIITSAKIRFLAGDYVNKFSVRTYALLGDPGLRMDALPPQFIVRVNDSLFVEGSSVYVSLPDDSARVGAYVSDEVAVDENSIWIEESGVEGRGIIPRSEYVIETQADTVAGASRRFYLYWPAVLRPASYDITLHATDVNGRETAFVLKVQLNVAFSSEGRTIRAGDWVSSSLAVSALVTSPVVLSQDELEFFVNGAAVVTSKQRVDSFGRIWRLDGELFLPEGEDTLAVKVGGIERSVTVNVTPEFSLRDVFCYPSPFDQVTSFNYELTGSPQEVLIDIFTVSGRKILDIKGDTRIGYNSVIWDGRDAEGNRIANGLYLYKLTAKDVDGKKESFLGKVVKVE